MVGSTFSSPVHKITIGCHGNTVAAHSIIRQTDCQAFDKLCDLVFSIKSTNMVDARVETWPDTSVSVLGTRKMSYHQISMSVNVKNKGIYRLYAVKK